MKTTYSAEVKLPQVEGVQVWASWSSGGASVYTSTDDSPEVVRAALLAWLKAVEKAVYAEIAR